MVPGTGRHKVTVRMDEDVWQGFNEFCTVNGVSMAAMFQACAWRSWTRHALHDEVPVSLYTDPRERDAMMAIVTYAREIDATRRSRGVPGS